MREVRFGIIGCGLMGREFASAVSRWLHLTETKARPVLVSVCDKNEDLMRWYQDNIPTVVQATQDYRELLANDDVDAVYCAVPHVLHEEFYKDILQSGKHLLGEKPFGMNVSQNRAIMAELGRTDGQLVRCSSEMPFFPGAQKVIDFVRSGRAGKIIEVEAAFLHSSDINPGKPLNWKRDVSINGEYGCMGDLGMHVLHVPLRLGWKPKTLHANLVKQVYQRPGPDGTMVDCTTWDNATISTRVAADGQDFPMVLKTWRIAPGESNTWSIRVLGMSGSAQFSTKSPRQWSYMEYEPGGPQEWRVEDLGFDTLFPTITGNIFEFGFSDAMQQMWAAFMDEVAGGDANGFTCATPEEAADHHAILTAALESGRTDSVQNVQYAGGA